MSGPAPPAAPLRVVRVIARLNMGGPARHVILLDRGLRDRGHHTLLAHGALDEGEGSLEHLTVAHGIPAVRVPGLGRRIDPASDARAFVRLLAILFRESPDVVHTHTAKAGTLGRLAAVVFNATRGRRRRCAVVHTFHGHVFEGYFHPVASHAVRLVERMLAACTDRIVTISPAQRRDISARFGVAPASKTVAIPLGLDLEALLRLPGDVASLRPALGIAPGDVVVGYVGRMVPIKGLQTLVSAFACAAERHTRLWLVLAGDGPLRGEIESRVARLGLSSRVRFVGWTDALPALYATIDICALASASEGTPVAIIEAMAAGRAVAATRVGGVPDVIDDGVNGLLVPPGDVEALAAALSRLASDAGERGRFGARARRDAARRYSVGRLVADVERMYREALGEKRRGR